MDKATIMRGQGFLKYLTFPIIVHAKEISSMDVAVTNPILQTDIDYCTYFNLIYVSNSSNVNLIVRINGNSIKGIPVPAGVTLIITEYEFQNITIYNADAANDTTAGQVTVTISKLLSDRNKVELKALGEI